MNTNEKNIAIREIKDMQNQIEQLELEWTKADKAGDKKTTEVLDRKIELLLATRRGMEHLLTGLKVKFDRKDYRLEHSDGTWEVKTLWYLI